MSSKEHSWKSSINFLKGCENRSKPSNGWNICRNCSLLMWKDSHPPDSITYYIGDLQSAYMRSDFISCDEHLVQKVLSA